ncbi:MAG: type II secretion system protein GspM [Gammaproteobacteria bacterium]|nr:type II secretion system protein GspM [Gammaproteobacteria bacterium]
MTAPLRRLWLARTPQERRLLVIAASVVLVILLAWLLVVGSQASTALRGSLPALRMQAITFEQQAAELEILRSVPAPTIPDAPLLPLIQETIASAAMSGMLSTIEPLGPEQVVVVFGAIEFSVWLAWIAVLEQQNVRVEQVRVETLATSPVPGLVSVAATLGRVGAP